jgi:hypothetical protein
MRANDNGWFYWIGKAEKKIVIMCMQLYRIVPVERQEA